ncbi:MAG: GGDEF domain-containing protein [Magnetovibrio sp.]|nr:GGDEF domain-containing protein [Magnetovibrio sp.]
MNETEIFPWNEYFEVGVEQSDVQHKRLVKIINEICFCALSSHNHDEIIDDLFQKLIDYTKYHFSWEERFYQANKLPTEIFARHKNNHDELIDQVKTLKQKYDGDGNKDANLEEILTTLVVWLTHHILEDDMRMCLIINNIKSGLNAEDAVYQSVKTMEGPKGTISRVMSSMMNVSSSSVLELRREISFRKKLELKLTEEISFRKKAEKKLKHLAQHDALTDLPNRYLFAQLCISALKTAKRSKLEQAILFIDIDGFKVINDTLGHQAGDKLLISIAKRLKKCIRESDIVARIGGDEFTVHLNGTCKSTDATLIAAKIIAALSQPFDLKDGTANIGASIGISLYPSDAKDVESLVKCADAAMYTVKKSGKNGFKLFSEL